MHTAWNTAALDVYKRQVLIGVAGRGWYQEEGKPAVEILPGTGIHIPANVKHWLSLIHILFGRAFRKQPQYKPGLMDTAQMGRRLFYQLNPLRLGRKPLKKPPDAAPGILRCQNYGGTAPRRYNYGSDTPSPRRNKQFSIPPAPL